MSLPILLSALWLACWLYVRWELRVALDTEDRPMLDRSERMAMFPVVERESRDGVNVTVVVKGVERYVFLYDDSHASDAIATAARWAAHSELSFTWYDRAVVKQKIQLELKRHDEACGGR